MDLFPSSDEVWLDGSASLDVFVLGLDEVGRGPLAGPVVAACVAHKISSNILVPKSIHIRDSKKLSAKQRGLSSQWIQGENSIHWALAERSAEIVDRINVLQATFSAMEEAFHKCIAKLPSSPQIFVLIDGNLMPPFLKGMLSAKTIIKGDSKSFAIAAASIVAKEYRDSFMADISKDFPEYGWDSNAGYGSEAHRNAISRKGLTSWHRRSFCKNFLACNDLNLGKPLNS